jgi:hypothetical protein
MRGTHSKPKAGETLSGQGKIKQKIARILFWWFDRQPQGLPGALHGHKSGVAAKAVISQLFVGEGRTTLCKPGAIVDGPGSQSLPSPLVC